MPKGSSSPKSSLNDDIWPASAEYDLALFLKTYEAEAKNAKVDSIPAFEALASIAAYMWEREEPSNYTIPVPWWIVSSIASRYCEYRDSAKSPNPITLGEAFKTEGGGQGKKPSIAKRLIHLRNIRIVTHIAFGRAKGIKLESLLQKMADETGLSLGQVRRIWERHGKRAIKAVAKFQERKTSRSNAR